MSETRFKSIYTRPKRISHFYYTVEPHQREYILYPFNKNEKKKNNREIGRERIKKDMTDHFPLL